MLRNSFVARSFGCIALCAAALSTPALAAVHAGDQLSITVYNHPELSRRVTVSASESLSLPLVGTVVVRGLETPQIAAHIENALRPYIKYPAVGVELSGQTSTIFISGGPGGVVKYEPGETLVAALADLASSGVRTSEKGGLAALERSRVDLRRVGVTRNGVALGTYDVQALASRGDGGPVLLAADTINLVNKPNAVRVLGDVLHPGVAYLANDETLADAIEQAGGAAPTAAFANLSLQRNGATQTLAFGDARLREPARDGDLVTVPTAPRVSVVGLVDKPGTVTLKADFSLLNALYQAGGPTKYADLSRVTLIHSGTQTTYNFVQLAHGDTAQNPALHDGDLVFVPEGRKVDVLPIFQSLLPLLYWLRV